MESGIIPYSLELTVVKVIFSKILRVTARVYQSFMVRFGGYRGEMPRVCCRRESMLNRERFSLQSEAS